MSNTGNMNEKENWIEGQLRLESFVQRAQASDDLKTRLRSIPFQVGRQTVYVPTSAIWAAAAAIALLITVNLVFVSNYQKTQQGASSDTETSSYFSYLESI